MRITTISLFSAALLLSAGSLQAQTITNCDSQTPDQAGSNFQVNCKTTTDLTANVPYLAVITKDITQAALPAATVNNMDKISDAVAGPTLRIKANFKWTLTADIGTGFDQLEAQGKQYKKESADLLITNMAGSDALFEPMNLPFKLASSNEIAATETIVQTQYKVLYRWDRDLPGSYTATVTYTLTAP